MQCTHHINKPIVSICVAPHKCQYQRKLCAVCQYEHGVDIDQSVPIQIFQEMVLKKLQDFKLDQSYELTQQKMSFKTVLSDTERMMKKIWQDLSESIKKMYEQIELENQSYTNLISVNTNLSESSSTDLEKLVSIVEGKSINDWNCQKYSYLKLLEKIKNGWDNGIQAFIQNSNEVLKKLQFIQMELNLVEGEEYQRKEDLYEILASVQDIDEQIYKGIIDEQRKEKISDIILSISKQVNLKQYESFVNEYATTSDIKKKIKKIINALRNILDHPFNKNDYSQKGCEKERLNVIKKISGNKTIIDFLKFLVQLTSIDEKFIRCGSNGLSLLVEMKVDLTNQSFEDIRIKNTSLIGRIIKSQIRWSFLNCPFCMLLT
ncbi:unnamed protein product [Paramecium sonneborni]|uniref:Uncharacterized protein n=1 Tax=Paramecium sonneborni TaxID=65129 RepID=A0A8S1NL31_9CILI|nr:unnamed protein product [Paramecium sonneborni]